MQTTASNLAKTKRGKTTPIRRCFRDSLEHFPTTNVKIGVTVCKLYQIYHFLAFFVVKSLKHKIIEFKKKKLFVGMSWTQCDLKEQNRLKNFGDLEKRTKSRKKSSFCEKFGLVCGGARLHFIAKRFGRPSFFIQRSNLSNIRVKSEGVVATAWCVGVEWPRFFQLAPSSYFSPLSSFFCFFLSECDGNACDHSVVFVAEFCNRRRNGGQLPIRESRSIQRRKAYRTNCPNNVPPS